MVRAQPRLLRFQRPLPHPLRFQRPLLHPHPRHPLPSPSPAPAIEATAPATEVAAQPTSTANPTATLRPAPVPTSTLVPTPTFTPTPTPTNTPVPVPTYIDFGFQLKAFQCSKGENTILLTLEITTNLQVSELEGLLTIDDANGNRLMDKREVTLSPSVKPGNVTMTIPVPVQLPQALALPMNCTITLYGRSVFEGSPVQELATGTALIQ